MNCVVRLFTHAQREGGLTMLQSAVKAGNRFGMNTEISYRAFGGKAEPAIAAITTELSRLENKLNRFIPDSEVSRINQRFCDRRQRDERRCTVNGNICGRPR